MISSQQQAELRAEARRREDQAKARRLLDLRIGAVTAVLVVVGATVALTLTGRDEAPTASVSEGALLTTAPPWAPQATGVAERLAPFDLPPVGDESYHAHALLSVYRNGEPVTVPANIGFDERGAHSSLHTHTPDGVIHMEADDPYPYELAQVFAAWGVAYDEDRLGGDVATGDQSVHVYVNGEPAPPGPVTMKDGDNIVVAYGTADSFPRLPSADALERA